MIYIIIICGEKMKKIVKSVYMFIITRQMFRICKTGEYLKKIFREFIQPDKFPIQ